MTQWKLVPTYLTAKMTQAADTAAFNNRNPYKQLSEMWTAMLSAAPPPDVQPVAYLANGARFKVTHDSRQSDGRIYGLPSELNGRWVALVAADDDCHLKVTAPDVQPVAWMSPNRERLEFSRNDTVYGSHTIPLYTHPPAADVQELVEALRDLCDTLGECGMTEKARVVLTKWEGK
jgi:hypothetical protein